MGLEIVRTAAPIGAEIRGVNLSKALSAEDFIAIERLFNEHGVIFFRRQFLRPSELLRFTSHFGEQQINTFSETHGLAEHPGIVVVSNIEEQGRAIGVKRAGERWHSDMCYTAKPPRGTILSACEVPVQDGLTLGDTCFAATHTGDVLLWDNCTVQHMALQDYDLPLRRLMYRTTFAADSAPM